MSEPLQPDNPPAPPPPAGLATPGLGSVIFRSVGLACMLAALITGRTVFCVLGSLALVFPLLLSTLVQFHYFRGLTLRKRLEDAPAWPAEKPWPEVALVSSARNEEGGIEAAVRSFAASGYENLSIYMIDDHSTDRTPEILDRLAKEFPQLRVIHDPPLQQGWGGKGNAVWYAINKVLPESCRWVLVTDADVRFHPDTVRAAVTLAEEANVDYFTCVPRMEPKGLWEEQGIITATWSLAIAAASFRPKGKEHPIGLGPFVLLTRDIYVRSGGHAPFRGADPEDTNLARVIHGAGARMGVARTSGMVRLRHYVGYEDLRRHSVMKNRVYLKDSVAALTDGLLHAVVTNVLPLPLAIGTWLLHPHTIPVCVFAGMALLLYLTEATRFIGQRALAELRWFVPWIHPLGGLMRAWFFMQAIGQALGNRGIAYRGRDVSSPPQK